MKTPETMGERLRLFIEHLGLSQSKFAKSIDTLPQYINNYITGRTSIELRVLLKIMDVFPQLNADWFVYGRGHMLIDQQAPQIVEALEPVDVAALKKEVSEDIKEKVKKELEDEIMKKLVNRLLGNKEEENFRQRFTLPLPQVSAVPAYAF